MIRKLARWALAAALLLGTAAGSAACQQQAGRPARHTIVVRYTPVQPLCHQLGARGVVVGDGKPFPVRCVRDGRIDVWDAGRQS